MFFSEIFPALQVYRFIQTFRPSRIIFKVCVELRVGVAVRFPFAVGRKIRAGHHAIERVSVNVIDKWKIAAENPGYIKVNHWNHICLCCRIVQAESETEAGRMR